MASLINGPAIPRGKITRAKLTPARCRKIIDDACDQGLSEEAVDAVRTAITLICFFSERLLSADVTAALFSQAGRRTATVQNGRPVGVLGVRTHDLDDLNDLKLFAMTLDDGSVCGRQKAIETAIENELPCHRPKLRRWLRRHLPAAGHEHG